MCVTVCYVVTADFISIAFIKNHLKSCDKDDVYKNYSEVLIVHVIQTNNLYIVINTLAKSLEFQHIS